MRKINKVLFVCSIYKPNIGGVETSVDSYCREYNKRGIRTCVLTKKYPETLADYELDGETEIIRVKRPLSDQEYFETLHSIMKNPKLQADIIHVVGVRRPLPLFALFLARYYKVPIIMTFVGGDVPSGISKEDIDIWEECKEDTIESIHQADAYAAYSLGIAHDAKKLMPFLNDVKIVYTGIDIEKINKIKKADIKGYYILTARRLYYNKGVDILLQSFPAVLKQFPHLRLYIIGDGPEEDKLKTLADNLGINENVVFVGSVSLEELYAFMKGAVAHICPSRAEGGGNVNIEASACGSVPIGSNVEGIPEYIKDGHTGLLFESENHSDLTDKIITVLKNREKADTFRKNGIDFARSFAIALKANEYLDLYQHTTTENNFSPWSKLTEKLYKELTS